MCVYVCACVCVIYNILSISFNSLHCSLWISTFLRNLAAFLSANFNTVHLFGFELEHPTAPDLTFFHTHTHAHTHTHTFLHTPPQLQTPLTSGISASDRARTIRRLADPSADASHFRRPGHIFPLRYRAGGVLARPGHTEVCCVLADIVLSAASFQ